MSDIKAMMEETKQKREACVVSSFTNEQAFDLGYYIYQKALREGKPLAVSVTRNRQRLFYAAAEGTTAENDHWIMRKENSAYFFGKTTWELSLYMKLRDDNIWDKYGLERDRYAQSGGCMPITGKGMGMIGTATVSGMSQAEDHEFITEAVLEWIENRQ